MSVRKRYAWHDCELVGLASHPPLQCASTGLLAWKHGQPGQVGNEAALTVVTSAEIRLVNLISALCLNAGYSAGLFESHHALVAQGA